MLDDARLAAFFGFLSAFHASEFGLAVARRDPQVSWSSFCFSWPYTAAMAAALLEYALESTYLPASWKPLPVSLAGGALAALGQALRWGAMVHAGPSFTHIPAAAGSPRRPGHDLVTTGPYAWDRHPAYVGWAAWAVGTQLLLANPACTVLFGCLAARFFAGRVRAEEAGLRDLFGEAYAAYARRVGTVLPGVACATGRAEAAAPARLKTLGAGAGARG